MDDPGERLWRFHDNDALDELLSTAPFQTGIICGSSSQTNTKPNTKLPTNFSFVLTKEETYDAYQR